MVANVFVVSIVRQLDSRHISDLFENWSRRPQACRQNGGRGAMNADSLVQCSHTTASAQWFFGSTGKRKGVWMEHICGYFSVFSDVVRVHPSHLKFDVARKRSFVRQGHSGSEFNVLILRYEDIDQWEQIISDVLPGFSQQMGACGSKAARVQASHRTPAQEAVYAAAKRKRADLDETSSISSAEDGDCISDA